MSDAITQNPRVILVDDDEAVLGAIRFMLETEGVEVQAFSDGSALMAHPEVTEGACLVLDYAMPGTNGIDLLLALRTRGVRAPAIIITADPAEHIRVRARSMEVSIIEKPALAGLVWHIGELLARSSEPATSNPIHPP